MARPIRDRPGCELGVAIDAIRLAEGWSLSDFAERAGLGRSAGPQVTKYRQGKHTPERERLEAWEDRPELQPHMPAIWRAIALDGAKRAAEAAEEKARATAARTTPARPKHVADALARVERVLMAASPAGGWIEDWLDGLEGAAKKRPLPNHRAEPA